MNCMDGEMSCLHKKNVFALNQREVTVLAWKNKMNHFEVFVQWQDCVFDCLLNDRMIG